MRRFPFGCSLHRCIARREAAIHLDSERIDEMMKTWTLWTLRTRRRSNARMMCAFRATRIVFGAHNNAARAATCRVHSFPALQLFFDASAGLLAHQESDDAEDQRRRGEAADDDEEVVGEDGDEVVRRRVHQSDDHRGDPDREGQHRAD